MSISSAAENGAAAEPNAVTIAVPAGAQVVTLPAGLDLGDAQFIRHGGDLEIVLPDGRHIVLPDFFDGAGSPALATADGQMLPADLVARLAGPLAPGQFAQADGGDAGLVQIGVVDKLSGTVTVRHADGTTETLQQGSPIYQGDEIITPPSGAVGIVLADRSTFSLGSSGRMVMDELVYDPAAKDGHASMSVLKGSFSFVSGQIAHSGPDAMQVRTPVMTIGVRGTTVAGQVGDNGETSVALVGDPGGGSGQITISNSSGIQVLSQPNTMLSVQSSFSPLSSPVVVEPGFIASSFGDAVGSLPVPPTSGNLEWNTVPGQNQPAPSEQIQQRPDAGATIQVDSPGGTQVTPGNQAPPAAPATPDTPPSAPAAPVEPTNTGNPGGGSGGNGDFTWYAPGVVVPPSTGGNAPVTSIAEIVQKGSSSASGGNSTAAELADGTSGTGSTGSSSSSGGAKQVVADTANGGGDIVNTVINGGSPLAGAGGITGGIGSGSGTSGSGAGGISSDLGNETPTGGGNTNPTGPAGNVRIIDGPVSGIFVFRDSNNDGRFDVGEAYGRTDANGYVNLAGTGGTIIALPAGTKFRDADGDGVFDPGEQYAIPNADGSVTVPGNGGSLVILPGGTDTTSGASVTIVLKAYGTSGVVTPLTTLLRELSGANPSAQTLAANEAKIIEALGLPAGTSLSTDPTGNAALSAAGAKVLAAVSVMTAGLGSGGQTSSSVFSALANVLHDAVGAVDFTTALSDTLTGLGLSGIKLNSLISLAAQAAALAQSNPTALDDFLDQNFDGLSSAGVTGDPNNIENIRGNLSYLQAQGVTPLHITSGSVTNLSPAEVNGLTFIVSGGAQVGVSGWANDINTSDFNGVTSIVVIGSSDATVVYGYDNFNAYRAITTTSDPITLTYGVRLSEGDSLVSWGLDGTDTFGVVRQIDVENGAHVTMSAAQLHRMASFGWPVNKNSGNLDVQVSGNVSGMILGQADRLIMVGDATLSKNQYVGRGENVVNEGGHDITLNGFDASDGLSGVDLAGVHAVVIGGTTILVHDGDSVEANLAALNTAGVTHYTLTSGSLNLSSYTEVASHTFVTSAGATVVVSDTGYNLAVDGRFTALKAAGVTDIVFTDVVGLSRVQLSELTTAFSGHVTATDGLVLILNETSSVGLSGFTKISVEGAYGFMSAQQINDLGAANIDLNGNILKARIENDVTGLNLSPANALWLDKDAIVTLAQLQSVNYENIYDNGAALTVAGVSGTLSLSAGYYAKIASLSLSGATSISLSQYQMLQAEAIGVTKNSNTLAVTSVIGDVSAVNFSGVDSLTATGAVTMTEDQYAGLRTAGATVAMNGSWMALTNVSGTVSLSAADLQVVNSLTFSGDVTLTQAQYAEISSHEPYITKGGYNLILSVSGNLSVNASRLGAVDAVDVTGDVTMTLAQYQALVEAGATFSVDGHKLTVTGVSGDISGLDLSVVTDLVLSGDTSMTPDQQASLDGHITGSGSVSAALDNVSDGTDQVFTAEGGSNVGFHGDLAHYRFSANLNGNAAVFVTDTRDPATADFDGADTITGIDTMSGGYSLYFADGNATLANDGNLYLDFDGGGNSVLIGSGLDIVRLNGGDDTLVVDEQSSLDGMVIQGNGGTDTIEVWSGETAVDISGATLSGFEKLKGGNAATTVVLTQAQANALEIDGAGTAMTVVLANVSDISGGLAHTVNWGSDDHIELTGQLNASDVLIGDNSGIIFDIGSGDQATGGTGDDIYKLVADGQSNKPFQGRIEITDNGGMDTIDVRILSENAAYDYAFDGLTRDGDDLVLHLDAAAGGGTVVIKDHFNGHAVERFLTSSSGDMYEYIASGLNGTALDEMIIGTTAGEVLTGGGGQDEFFGGGGADTFVGDGKDGVNYTVLTNFNSDAGGLIMTGALSASGNGTASLNNGLGETWTQTYQGITDITGTGGDDVLYGAAVTNGYSTLNGGLGDDVLYDGGTGRTVADYSDTAGPYSGVNISLNEAGTGTVTGASGTDTTHGIHHFVGSAFGDSFYGSSGNDTFEAGGGNDTFSAGDGWDTITFWNTEAGVHVDLSGNVVYNDGFGDRDTIYDVEQVIGSKFDDVIAGNNENNALSGQAGADELTGGGGADQFIYDQNGQSTVDACDTITDFGNGTDTINLSGAAGYTAAAETTVSGSPSMATAISSVAGTMAANSIIFFTWNGDGYVYVKGAGTGSVSYDGTVIRLAGVTSAPVLSGGGSTLAAVPYATEDNDILAGTSGDDNIAALGGDDTILASAGTDIVDGGDGIDTLDYSGTSASVNANFISHTATSGGSTTTFSAIEAITGSAYDDTFQGSDSDVIIRGGGGDDQIYGGSGADSLYGDDGRDTFIGGDGNDYIDGGEGEDSLLYTASSAAVTVDLLAGIATGEGTDTLVGIEAVTGSAHDDTITGAAAAETLNGYHGADMLTGGGGGDSFVISNFYQSNLSDGYDTITDFGTGNDRIVFTQAAGYTYNSNLVLSTPADLATAVTQADSLLSGNQIGFFVYNGDGYLYAKGAGGDISFDTTLVKLTGVTSAPLFDGTSVFTSSAVVASSGDDVLIGTSGDDNIVGLAGNDMLDGGAGNDMLSGGEGDDILTGGIGNDTFLLGEGGTDTITDFGANGDIDALALLIDGGGRVFQHLADGGVVGRDSSVVAMDSLTSSGEHLVANVVAGKINTLSGLYQGSQGVFLVSDGSATAVWRWADVSADQTPADGRVTTNELSLIGVLNGVSVANLTAANLSDFAALESGQTEWDDYVIGTSGADVIASLAGDDLIVANGGADQIDAGNGFDRIYLRGADMAGATVDGGQGQDSLIIAGAGAINLDDLTFTRVENVEFQGTMPGTDHVTSVSISAQNFATAVMTAEHSEGAAMFFGANGLNGNHGVDFSIDASAGGDLLESLSNVYFHDLTSLTIDASAATNALTASAMVGEYATTVLGGTGNDSVNVSSSVTDQTMQIDLGQGDDTLTVGGYVSLSSHATLEGGDGTDQLVVGYGATLNGAAIHGFELIDLTNSENWALGGLKINGAGGNQSVEIDISAGTFDVSSINFVNWDSGDNLFISGSGSDDVINGSNLAETIGGSGGNDVLTGNGGADVFLFGGSGAVASIADMGTDTVTDFTTGVDKIALDVDFFSLGGTGSLSASQFWQSTLEMDASVGGDYSSDDSTGAGIIVIGSGDDSQVWYTADVSSASQTNSYQLATLTGVDSTTVQSSDFEKVA